MEMLTLFASWYVKRRGREVPEMDCRVWVKWTAKPSMSAASRYGLAVISVAAALGLARAFVHFNLPQPFAAFALSAIAVTFWYAGTAPGVLAAVLSSLVRGYLF